MKKILILMLLTVAACSSQDSSQNEQANNTGAQSDQMSGDVARWEAQAKNITIIRDDWGVPHIYGKTDADAVFGVMYAQAEDDFNRVEVNYMNAMGLLAQAEGEDQIFRDLRMRLFIQQDDLKKMYAKAPDWLKKLMDAYADGLNYYLHTHPETKPKVIKHFEPWMALSFSEGSIGGDIESISINDLQNFYGGTMKMAEAPRDLDMEPRGSNGMAIAPKKTKDGHAMLYINPHTTHYFREEAHMVSDEGLDAYGALTWGQFFIYQGFSEYNGWMHTSSRADVIDEYAETIIEKDGKLFYKFGEEERPVTVSTETIDYKTDSGMESRDFTVYHTHHGPIIRSEGDKWISVQLMNIPLTALNQSYTRTKTHNYQEFFEMMRLKSNSSNNTVYADKDGNIAYFHGNFLPIRNTKYDFNHPVDGSNPDTDWKGLHTVEESIHLLNPESGWLYNSNNWPFTAAGPGSSPKKEDYPSYMSVNFENPRGEHAVGLYPKINDFTIDSLIEAGYDGLLPSFQRFVPVLKAAYDAAPDPSLKEAVDMLVAWDKRSSMDSVETSLAHHFGNELFEYVPRGRDLDPFDVYEYAEKQVNGDEYLAALKAAMDRMVADFGTWKVKWGDMNRFQRNDGSIEQTFDDNKPSYPVKLASGRWGALASVGTRQYPGTKNWYVTSGNSFIASIEFGDKVKAKALMAGGLSSDPNSPHFFDQGEMYGKGEFRDVYYYREDVDAHAERQYHPGE
ncbi:MAG: penicillin acylase family protein [Alphaproteobacteria bacterium]|nr:penicillin acylase family protein [Alphaproteobacteria bacterium]HPF47530.1 penicillin acylase family protein [Emcibacteraceae bacterium]